MIDCISATARALRLRPLYQNHVWSYDSVYDRLSSDESIRMLTMLDKYTRKCLKTKVGYNLNASDILKTLSELFFTECVPEYIRIDNGSEFVAQRVKDFLKTIKVQIEYNTPVSP